MSRPTLETVQEALSIVAPPKTKVVRQLQLERSLELLREAYPTYYLEYTAAQGLCVGVPMDEPYSVLAALIKTTVPDLVEELPQKPDAYLALLYERANSLVLLNDDLTTHTTLKGPPVEKVFTSNSRKPVYRPTLLEHLVED